MKIRNLSKSILPAAIAAAVVSVPMASRSDDSRFSQFKKSSQFSRGNSNSQSSYSKENDSSSNRNSYRGNSNSHFHQAVTSKSPQNYNTQLKRDFEKKATYQPQESVNRYQSKDIKNDRYQPDNHVRIPTKNWKPEEHYKPVETKPDNSKPERPYQPSGNKAVDVGSMVSILKGKTITAPPGVVSNKTKPEPSKVVDRVVPVNPNALPKGMGTYSYMKKGKTPAEGLAEGSGGGTATVFMKKGKDHAEGESEPGVPVVVRIKDGRPSAESDSYGDHNHNHNHGYPGNYGGSEQSLANYSGGSTGGYSAAGSPSLAYRVDSSSQLATNSVKFQRGSTELADAESYYYLQNLASALRDPSLANDRFVVEGHASAEGSSTANLILSQQRANAIFDFLISQGIPTDRLLSVGHGEFQARYAATDPEYLRAQDRQVIVFKLAE